LVDQWGLRAGHVLSVEDQSRLIDEDEPFRARSRSLKLLAVRDRSREEVRSRLRDAGFRPEVVVETIQWLAGLGYLEDRRFATRLATERLRGGWSERRVRMELQRKGIDREIGDEVLAEVVEHGEAARQGSEAVYITVVRRFGGGFSSDPRGTERRVAAFLARRGFDWEAIDTMVHRLRVEGGAEGGGSEGDGGP